MVFPDEWVDSVNIIKSPPVTSTNIFILKFVRNYCNTPPLIQLAWCICGYPFTSNYLYLWLYSLFPIESCCSITKWCLILCDPMDCSMPSFLVFHYLSELVQAIESWILFFLIQSNHLCLLTEFLVHLLKWIN